MQRLQLWFHIAPLDVTRTCSTQIIRFFRKNLQGSGNIIGCLVETCGVWRCWHFFCALDEELGWDLLLLQTRPSFGDIDFTTAFFPRPQGWMSFLECQKSDQLITIFWCHDFQGSPLALVHFIWNILYIYIHHIGCTCLSCLKHLGHLLNQSFTLWSYWKAYHWLVRSTIVKLLQHGFRVMARYTVVLLGCFCCPLFWVVIFAHFSKSTGAQKLHGF